MSLWERKRSPRPIPLPSWDCPPEYIICRCFLLFSNCIFILLCWGMFPLCPLCWEFLSYMDAEFCPKKKFFFNFWHDHMIFFSSYLIWYIVWPLDAKNIWKDPDAGKDWAGGEGDDRGWDGWMASPIQWTWLCIDSGNWWWTGRPGILWFMVLQRVGHNWATELNCWFADKSILIMVYYCF